MTVTCKNCSGCFKSNTFLKHISKNKLCKSAYTSKELSDVENASAARKRAKGRKSYNQAKSNKNSAKEEEGKFPNQKNSTNDMSENEDIECAGCNYSFEKQSILKHVVKSADCSSLYNSSSKKSQLESLQKSVESFKKSKKEEMLKKLQKDYSANMLRKEIVNEHSSKSLQWCAYQNQYDPIYVVIVLFLTLCLTI